jgi:hypothetical protein
MKTNGRVRKRFRLHLSLHGKTEEDKEDLMITLSRQSFEPVVSQFVVKIFTPSADIPFTSRFVQMRG